MPNSCLVCGRVQIPGSDFRLHRFPKCQELGERRLEGLHLTEGDIGPDSRVCRFNFRDGDVKNLPFLSIGTRFGTGSQKTSLHAKRAGKPCIVHLNAPNDRSKHPLVHHVRRHL